MSKTPTKLDIYQYRPREIPTPNKDQQEISKMVYTHVSHMHRLIFDWLKIKNKGSRFLKLVSGLKIHECLNDYYPSQLKIHMETLLEQMDKFKNIMSAFTIINGQLQALAKLQPNNDPAISTWSVTQIAKYTTEIVASLEKEYELKEAIIENVAHCRDECMIEVYITSWENDVYLNIDSFSYLLAEVGLTGVA